MKKSDKLKEFAKEMEEAKAEFMEATKHLDLSSCSLDELMKVINGPLAKVDNAYLNLNK